MAARDAGRPPLARGWLAAAAVMVVFIWCNSLAPGTQSGGLSLAVVGWVRSALEGAGLPSAWVTNFLVRKCAHFTEYAVLGHLVARGIEPRGRLRGLAWAALVLPLVLVPSIDETIQLFVPGRTGTPADVLLDCCGAAAGAAAARLALARARRRGA